MSSLALNYVLLRVYVLSSPFFVVVYKFQPRPHLTLHSNLPPIISSDHEVIADHVHVLSVSPFDSYVYDSVH